MCFLPFAGLAKVGGGGRIADMSRIQFIHTYQYIISVENLLDAWKEFICGKRSRRDVQEFEIDLMSNILSLHRDLITKQYRHSAYEAFNISDPKPRNIHKASVRDRLLHHALYRVMYPFFDKTFVPDSYSCRIGKGTHKAIQQFQRFAYQASNNHAKTVWALKCDIKKFFANIDHVVLLTILKQYIPNRDIVWLLDNIISSFQTGSGKGLPLGNLTSQLFVNIYMNEFDQFVKQQLKVKYYIRYADDFVILSTDKNWLITLVPVVQQYLAENLSLDLHPNKVSIQTLAGGVDFLGWVHLPAHRVLRTATKRRMRRRIIKHPTNETMQSYLGMLQHGDAYALRADVLNTYGLWNSA